ncbi:MAG TPA: hypothetical protein VE821_05500 [Pyrinomonadaceae bacterium]|nr:hypothetical protein [Pyrinomonadaceae bacterium]
MPVKSKKETTDKKRSKVKVGKLQESTKELSANEQRKVKGGGSYTVTVKVKGTA